MKDPLVVRQPYCGIFFIGAFFKHENVIPTDIKGFFNAFVSQVDMVTMKGKSEQRTAV